MTKKRLMLLFLAAAVGVSTIVIVNFASTRPSKLVKEGKISDIEYYVWHNHDTLSYMAQVEYGVTEYFLDRPSVTILYFEDGEAIPFVGVLGDVESGMKIRIVYHEQYVHAGNVYWTDNYYLADSIETIE